MLFSRCISPPEWAKRQSLLTSAQRAGLRYQERVATWLRPQVKALGMQMYSELWFTDPLTGAPCSPDILLESPSSCLLLIEVKLTQVDCSNQLAKYRRALEKKTKSSPLVCIQVCRRLTSPSTMQSLEDAHDNGLMLLYL